MPPINTPSPFDELPKPLRPAIFYILLALVRGASHGYVLKNVARNDSFGSVKIPVGKLYDLLMTMFEDDLIELAGDRPAGKSGILRTHYRISQYGTIRLKEELVRMAHAAKIGEAAGLLDDQMPLDLQRLKMGRL